MPRGFAFALATELTPVQVLRFRERAGSLRGAEVSEDVLRSYPNGSLAAHVLGYTSSITEEEYLALRDRGYRISDRIGRFGLEKVYESHLRGEWGGQQLEVNAEGQVQRVLGDKPAKAGKDLRLTLDLDLQRAAEKALDGVRKGAIVAMDPQHRRDAGHGQPPQLRSQHLLRRTHHRPVERAQSAGGADAQPGLPGVPPGQHLQDRHHDRRARVGQVHPDIQGADHELLLLLRPVLRRSRCLRQHRLCAWPWR